MIENQGVDLIERLKSAISADEFNHFISQIRFNKEASKSDLLIFNAPNDFIAKWISTKYVPKMLQIYESQYGNRPKIEVLTLEHSPKKPKQSILKVVNKNANLNLSYSFENFVVGDSNKFAYESALKVAEVQATAYNPLLIWGGTGLGKTHLLNAIGNKNTQKKVIYTTCEQFLNDYTLHLQNKTMDKFREKYRQCDYLLIDDVQFLAGKEYMQEEFFHTFNDLKSNNRQIVLTSDKLPRDIDKLEERLKSRFQWGMVVNIKPPELVTKIDIIRKKCQLDKIVLDDDTIRYIAQNSNNNIREIESILIQLNAYASMVKQEITLALAQNMLGRTQRQMKNISLDDILSSVGRELNVKPSEIKSKSRQKEIVRARKIVIYLARSLTPNSMPELAKFFDMKDHSSISKTMRTIENEIKQNQEFKNTIEHLKSKIQEMK